MPIVSVRLRFNGIENPSDTHLAITGEVESGWPDFYCVPPDPPDIVAGGVGEVSTAEYGKLADDIAEAVERIAATGYRPWLVGGFDLTGLDLASIVSVDLDALDMGGFGWGYSDGHTDSIPLMVWKVGMGFLKWEPIWAIVPGQVPMAPPPYRLAGPVGLTVPGGIVPHPVWATGYLPADIIDTTTDPARPTIWVAAELMDIRALDEDPLDILAFWLELGVREAAPTVTSTPSRDAGIIIGIAPQGGHGLLTSELDGAWAHQDFYPDLTALGNPTDPVVCLCQVGGDVQLSVIPVAPGPVHFGRLTRTAYSEDIVLAGTYYQTAVEPMGGNIGVANLVLKQTGPDYEWWQAILTRTGVGGAWAYSAVHKVDSSPAGSIPLAGAGSGTLRTLASGGLFFSYVDGVGNVRCLECHKPKLDATGIWVEVP